MTPLDCMWAATDSLCTNPLRSALTALGIIVGVAAVVAKVAVGAGAEHRIEAAIHNIGSNLLVVGNGSRTASGQQIGRGKWLTLTEQDAAALAQEIPSVQVAAGSVAGTGQVVFGNKNWATTLRGVTPDYFLARNWTVVKGRHMTPAEQRSAAKVALLGKSVVDALFGGTAPIGQTIRIKRVPFTVIGEMGEKGPSPWGGHQDDVVFMPLSTAKKRVFGGRQLRGDLLGQITVKTVSADAVKAVESEVKELLRRRHKLMSNELDDFFVSNVAEVMEARVESSRVMSNLLASVAGISLLVGGIGIMNIMLVSVTERTREIGLRMAVGAKRGDIMMQFVIESLLLSMIGGLVGIALGIGGSMAISHFAEWPVLIGFETVLIAALFSATVGIFFGYYPARKAARLDPIEALRQE